MIAGALTTHEFDVGIANGTPLLAIEALSFEGTGHHMKREVDATAWSLDDVGKTLPRLDLAVVALPPKTARSTTYDEARKVFEGLHAEVVEEDEVDDWSKSKVEELL